MKRASHVGSNACNARIQRVLHRICYSNVAHMKRASSVQHPRNIRTTFAQHMRDIRAVITAFDALHDAFVARVSSFHVLHMSRTSSA
jgi:hypothetical protein